MGIGGIGRESSNPKTGFVVSPSATVATNIVGLVKLYREYEPPKYWVIKQANYMVI